MSNSEIIAFLTENPGSTAKECGATNADMQRLVRASKVMAVGTKKGKGRGRPSTTWALADDTAPEIEPIEVDQSYRKELEGRPGYGTQEKRMLDYIDRQIERGTREDDDMKVLLGRKKEIIKVVKRNGPPLVS